jgi:hypothetical protein
MRTVSLSQEPRPKGTGGALGTTFGRGIREEGLRFRNTWLCERFHEAAHKAGLSLCRSVARSPPALSDCCYGGRGAPLGVAVGLPRTTAPSALGIGYSPVSVGLT